MMLNTSGSPISGKFPETIRKELGRILSKTLNANLEIISGLDKIRNLSSWYREAKEDPSNIPTMIINGLIGRLAEQIEPVFTTFIIDKIKIETENRKDEFKIKLVEINFSVKPFVEYLKKVDGIECNKIRITFNVSVDGRLEDITIHSDMSGRHIMVSRISSNLSISIDSGTLSPIYAPIALVPKPIVLYHIEIIKLENISFHC